MPLMVPGSPKFTLYESNHGATPSENPGTAVSHPAGGPHVKNTTFTQLIASTAFDAQLVIITVSQNSVSNGDSSTLLDIAIGAAASETVIIPNIAAGFVPAGSAPTRYYPFPLYIPAGSRLSARTQSIRTTGDVTVLAQLYGGPRSPDRWWCGSQVTTYGADLATSAGTKITPGDTGAEGTSVSLGTTSTSHECLVLGAQGHPDDVSYGGNRTYRFDVGIDSSSTDWILTDGFQLFASSAEFVGHQGGWHPIMRSIPSGTELMVSAECNSTADALSVLIHGVS